MFASRWLKKDVMEGWYWRLRMWPLECVVVAIVWGEGRVWIRVVSGELCIPYSVGSHEG